MFDKILPAFWMTLPHDIREHLAHVFHVARSGISEVCDATHVSDGRTVDDLAVITAERMADYVGSVEPFSRLWEITIAKARHELHPPIGIIMSQEAIEDARDIINQAHTDEKPKRKRTKKEQV